MAPGELCRRMCKAAVRRGQACSTHRTCSSGELPVEEVADAGNHGHRQGLWPRPVEHRGERHHVVGSRRGSPACRRAPRQCDGCRGRRADQDDPPPAPHRRAPAAQPPARDVGAERKAGQHQAPAGFARQARRPRPAHRRSRRGPSSQRPSDSPTPRKLKRTRAVAQLHRRRAPASAPPCCPSCRRAAGAGGRPPPGRAARPGDRQIDARTRWRRPGRRSLSLACSVYSWLSAQRPTSGGSSSRSTTRRASGASRRSRRCRLLST